ncbi:MAG: hypothetical protein WC982_13140 [Advenella sp.]
MAILVIDKNEIDEATRMAMTLPGIFTRARVSALKSLGWMIRSEVVKHIRTNGSGQWPRVHPFTLRFGKGFGGAPKRRRRRSSYVPYRFLNRLVRYRVDDDGEMVQIDIGKGRGGQPGQYDREMFDLVRRVSTGQTVRVTQKMRGWFGLTRYKDPWSDTPEPYGRLKTGETFFPLRKSTTELKVPPRPIFDPVWRKTRSEIPGHFADRFWRALKRYSGQKGGAKA